VFRLVLNCSLVTLAFTAGSVHTGMAAETLAMQVDSQNLPSMATAMTAVKTPIHNDPSHPLMIGYEFYPKQSLKSKEEGTCYIAILVGPQHA
jgi:hypothetical protein